jgi:hypothetical protein
MSRRAHEVNSYRGERVETTGKGDWPGAANTSAASVSEPRARRPPSSRPVGRLWHREARPDRRSHAGAAQRGESAAPLAGFTP